MTDWMFEPSHDAGNDDVFVNFRIAHQGPLRPVNAAFVLALASPEQEQLPQVEPAVTQRPAEEPEPEPQPVTVDARLLDGVGDFVPDWFVEKLVAIEQQHPFVPEWVVVQR